MQMQISSLDFPYNLRLMMIWIQMNTVCATTTDELPFTAGEIAEGTKKDTLLVKVYECTSFGWPGSCPIPELKPFWNRRDEISLKTDVSHGADVSSYLSNSKNAYWKS